jgi:hypothetical protein
MTSQNRRTLVDMVQLVERTHGAPAALGEAVRWSMMKEVSRLLDSGIPVDVRIAPHDMTSLMYCSNERIATLLIRRGADINAEDATGRTPLLWFLLGLHRSAHADRYIRALLRCGADVTAVSQGGESAESLAQAKYGDRIATLLRAARDGAMHRQGEP